MAQQFELSGSQIDGARDYQEDAFLITNLTDSNANPSALVIVADGMGGHAAGNVASNMAVQAFNKHVSANYPGENPGNILYECVLKANSSIKDTVKETPALSGMGCTMVAAILEDGKLWWASVGDSHLYLIRDNMLMKQNADHSYGGFLDRMEAAGTPVEPEPGLARNMLMSAITGEDVDEIDVSDEPLELEVGDRIILCSDGLDTLSTGKIIQYAETTKTPRECAEDLLEAVEEADMPKQDNTTVVVVDVKARQATAAQAPAPEEAPEEIVVNGIPQAEKPPAPAAGPAPEEDTGGGRSLRIPWRPLAMLVLIAVAVGAFVTYRDQLPSLASLPSLPSLPDFSPTVDEPAEPVSPATDSPPATAAEPAPAGAPQQVEPAPAPVAEKPAQTHQVQEFRDTLSNGAPGPTMVWIPAGSFDMGSPGTSGNATERPRHTVTVDRFAISKHEITFAQYDRYARATGKPRPASNGLDRATYPVTNVTWEDARGYARWLSQQTGENYRLPSEAEWEYAAGTGETATFWWGFREEQDRAHCFGCGAELAPRQPTEVGSFDANAFGVHDTAGNVAEWVQDCWHESYEGAPGDGSVWEGGDCSMRMVRGGAYTTPFQSLRHASRDRFAPGTDYDHIGIRVVRDP